SSGIAVMVERTRENAILSPIEGTSNELELLYLRDNADIVPGDVIITSGIGGIYPKGIQVGKVIEVSTENAREKKVKILSTVDFDHIEEVTIVLHVYNEGTD
ncbi:MAG: rod shape-determining protein MreC, partial [Clostridia bacterium]|nr:rod shape-determining protein MreC [Clostridia bacterium]